MLNVMWLNVSLLLHKCQLLFDKTVKCWFDEMLNGFRFDVKCFWLNVKCILINC